MMAPIALPKLNAPIFTDETKAGASWAICIVLICNAGTSAKLEILQIKIVATARYTLWETNGKTDIEPISRMKKRINVFSIP